jgi:lipopolysaccharide export LptBFGC system permease protein LptF
MKNLFNPLFRNLDQEISVLEKRIELRRGLVQARQQELHARVVETLTSPLALAGAAVVGVLLARGSRRATAPAASRAPRKGLWAGLGGVAFSLLQMRFGSPYQWIVRALISMNAARGRRPQAQKGGN